VVLTDRDFLQDIPEIDRDTYLVIVTRCHATDQLLVKRYLNSPAAYIGLIGSTAKVRQFRKELMQDGVLASDLDRIHAPIGLPIGGKDPAEVAVSILAEVIQVKNQAQSAIATPGLQIKKRHP
jgi:xanthine dehydrogenase accessory factor